MKNIIDVLALFVLCVVVISIFFVFLVFFFENVLQGREFMQIAFVFSIIASTVSGIFFMDVWK